MNLKQSLCDPHMATSRHVWNAYAMQLLRWMDYHKKEQHGIKINPMTATINSAYVLLLDKVYLSTEKITVKKKIMQKLPNRREKR